MSTETNYVKCENCGRRLPGSSRKCDVCGGRMTSRAENSYYTPEGVVSKHSHVASKGKTPDSHVKRTTSHTSNESGSSQSNYDKPKMIDRLGDAVDVFASEDGMEVDNLRKIGKILKGDSSNNYTGSTGTASSGYTNYEKKETSSLASKVIGSIALGIGVIAIIINLFGGLEASFNDYDDSGYESGEEYVTVELNDVVSTDNYTLAMSNIEYIDDADFGSEATLNFTVVVIGTEDIELKPEKDFELIDADGKTYNADYVFINNDNDGSEEMYDMDMNAPKSYSLKSGETYNISIDFYTLDIQGKFTFKHNLGQKLPRDNAPTPVNIDLV